VWRVVSEVFALNMLLALLAIASTRFRQPMTISLLIGAAAVGLLMGRFSRRGASCRLIVPVKIQPF
jgi:hypothetical protein